MDSSKETAMEAIAHVVFRVLMLLAALAALGVQITMR